ncbi:AT-hook motif nuclear-localized protein 13 isoform X2 [Humulus lupulus]|uniref:AT-hook motif nuclear-localized protein 13 isoform X2 n=1 Tax=Humulus lupulus TaxID=3486 RepID=UPI002B41671C|nr:AT-hook motif nuclear-localized protein 13 isoform X2 [Humulus lupulus]
MDSRDAGPPVPPNMMMGHNSYPSAMPSTNASSMMMSPNSMGSAQMMAGPGGGRFPFSSVTPPASKPMDSLSSHHYDGSSSPGMRACSGSGGGGGGFNMDSGSKKKRGRPRKYSPDGNIALGLAPTPTPSSNVVHGDSSGTPSSEPSAKKNRGRPPGSGKKQLDALGVGGVGFTPHVILVKTGEDVASKVISFSEEGPRTVCILSANGAVCNATLRQPAMSGGNVSYEGRYEIISLSGSYLFSDNNGKRSRTGGLSVSLAGPDGRVVGGSVAGILMAASPVQVIVGSFIADGKKSHSNNTMKTAPGSGAPLPQMLNFGVPNTAGSPPSQGESSESSEENGNSPLNRGPGFYNNNNNGQPLHSMQMYHHHLWAGQTQQ